MEELTAGLLGNAGEVLHLLAQTEPDHMSAQIGACRHRQIGGNLAGIAVTGFQAIGDQDDVRRFGGAGNLRAGLDGLSAMGVMPCGLRALAGRQTLGIVAAHGSDDLDIATVAAPIVAISQR
ncbi:hypothetical protein DSL92_08715 [Billgrantia gudaonensis]|uniref:Uncharacterized protein n=1 Tax=Billgrantia gudaonensis TaxID=376427 RepID=A0A432JI04_9GAMM|nr:hypothetical protein DSL92_08715 [Halomonas gudaonensis]